MIIGILAFILLNIVQCEYAILLSEQFFWNYRDALALPTDATIKIYYKKILVKNKITI